MNVSILPTFTIVDEEGYWVDTCESVKDAEAVAISKNLNPQTYGVLHCKIQAEKINLNAVFATDAKRGFLTLNGQLLTEEDLNKLFLSEETKRKNKPLKKLKHMFSAWVNAQLDRVLMWGKKTQKA